MKELCIHIIKTFLNLVEIRRFFGMLENKCQNIEKNLTRAEKYIIFSFKCFSLALSQLKINESQSIRSKCVQRHTRTKKKCFILFTLLVIKILNPIHAFTELSSLSHTIRFCIFLFILCANFYINYSFYILLTDFLISVKLYFYVSKKLVSLLRKKK